MADGKYRLYGRRNAGSLAPQILLEEAGAAYELIWISRAAADLEVLRRVNPAGKIPCLVLPDGTAVAESAAILIHLTHAHPQAALAPPPGSSAHARWLQWMVYLSANLYDAAPAIKTQALADYDAHLERVHGELSPYVLGDRLSAADPYLHMLACWHPEAAALRARLPRLAQHAEQLRRRPATVKAERDHAED
jgi:glutathione S-transferase